MRRAVPSDISVLVDLRMALFAEVDGTDPAAADPQLAEATRRYIEKALADGSLVVWVAECQGEIVGTHSLAYFQRPPYPGNLTGREAYLLNVYSVPSLRRQGIATALIEAAMATVRVEGMARVWLHASTAGRPLYEKAGFRANGSEMEWLNLA
ncbi:MAG: GNAT family N-acetyltransferase [Methylococcaceae bacterium]|nr:GNAT family N-acetyltransferase [Methylococcaceae bacterium]